MPPFSFVGIDMGTTNTRAWLTDGDRIVARARAGTGVRDAAVAGSNASIRAAIGELVGEIIDAGRRAGDAAPECVLAAGMITSSLGLAEVPHVPAPAGVAELAAGVARFRFEEIDGLDVFLLPGVRTGESHISPDHIGSVDVMRGEETLCIGLLEAGLLRPGGLLLNLGSHWKTVSTDAEGRVTGSTTSLSGELLHAAQTRTLLAASVPQERPEGIDEQYVRAGLTEAQRGGLARALFCVRLLEQRTASTPRERLSFLLGAFVGGEVEALERRGELAARVVLAGGEAIASAFALALVDRGIEARVLSPEEVEAATVRGLARIGGAALALPPAR